MPKIPRDIGSGELTDRLKAFGYTVSRQTGSHIRLTATIDSNEQSITIPAHNPIKIGTLNRILLELSQQLKIEKSRIIHELFF